MSLCRCVHRDEKLPDNVTCGGLCPSFPACLPPPSAELLGSISKALRPGSQPSQPHRRRAALASTPGQASTAIPEGKGARGFPAAEEPSARGGSSQP
jgi:hypothetical protein